MRDKKKHENVEQDFEIIKITNPNWLGVIGPQIQSFTKKINLPNITYETLFTYFINTIQYGGDAAEFHVTMEGKSPVAFAHWFVCGLPHRGAVYMDWIYSWTKKQRAVSLLVDEFVEFGKKQHAPIYKGQAISLSVYRLFRKLSSEKGYKLDKTSLIDFIGRK
ncbi:MAG: hypothetical protein ACYSTX_00065 [Planctomycetota bacterium]|jgi:hypothetical protein